MAPAPLQFYSDIDAELAAADTLVVLARGLGMASVLARFVASRVRPGRLILALNISRDIAVHVVWPALRSAAAESPPEDPSLLLPRFVNADYSVADRASVYDVGGFVIASDSVLVNDLLCRKVPADKVDGVVVFAADRVRPHSNTHFALTLFRAQNRVAFIKALSENAPGLTVGFHHAEKVMRTLLVSRLSSWPRFHKVVKDSFARRTPSVVQLSVALSRSQARVLASLRNIANLVLDDLRAASHCLDLSEVYRKQPAAAAAPGDEPGPKQLVSNFDDVVCRQLAVAPGVRRVAGGERVRSLVEDLRTVRKLLSDAIDLNPVLFYQRVLTLRHTQERNSYWLMRREAQNMLRDARARIFVRRRASSSIAASNALPRARPSRKRSSGEASAGTGPADGGEPLVTVPVLDASPKWEVLRAVLDEIETDVRKIGPDGDVGRVLIAVRDQCGVDDLRHMLTAGARPYMRRLFEAVLPGDAKDAAWNVTGDEQVGPRQATLTQLIPGSGGGGGGGGGATSTTAPRSARRTRSGRPDTTPSAAAPRPGSSRRRAVNGGGDEARPLDSAARAAFVPIAHSGEDVHPWPWPVRLGSADGDVDGAAAGAAGNDGNILCGLKQYFGRATAENPAKEVEVLLWCLEWADVQGRAKALLAQYKPSFVVMYNADVALVRQVEVFRAESPGRAVRLYLLAYEDAVDEDRYRSALEREKGAFKTLIRERATMVVHADQEGRLDALDGNGGTAGVVALAGRSLGADRDSRTGPAAAATSGGVQDQVLVDMRELRSALPMALHQAGLLVLPMTLEVGDFVLSRSIAVERKSVPDLFGSFTSGRLFNQAEALCRHYKHACLMIELEANARFSLAATSGGVPSELVPSSIVSKMVLLVQQFPKLRLLWARGPQEAAELFLSLKANAEQPDAAAAAALGVDSVQGTGTEFNAAPATLLRNLPGIDGNNVASVMRKVASVSALLNLPLIEMEAVLGSPGKAQRLYEFANERPSEALGALV
jgi:DNA excision repair protein ERCC-4